MARDGIVEYKNVDLNKEFLNAYETGTFDLVLCSDVLEHLENPAAVLRELARVAKPEATVIISLPNAFNWVERLAILLTGNSTRYRTESPDEFGHISMLPTAILHSLCQRTTLSIRAVRGGFAYFGRWFLLPGRICSPHWSYYVIYRMQTDTEDLRDDGC